jgi:acetolactate synthase-1/2/3 large subunit
MWTFSKVNFARIAEEMGAVGMRVEDPKELPGALQRALKANRPVILDVVTDIEVIAPGAWVK